MTPRAAGRLLAVAAIVSNLVVTASAWAGIEASRVRTAAYAEANHQLAEFGERENKAAHEWAGIADGYAKQLTDLQERFRTLEDKYTNLLNKNADDQWRILHLEHVKAPSPAWLTAAWPLVRCESTYRADAVSTATINGVTYEQLGLMQLLWDAPMQQLAHELGYTREALLTAGPNLHTAAVWAQRTDRGVPFRLWGCK